MKKFKLLLFFTFFSFLFTFFYFNVSEEFIYTKNIETVSTGQNREIMVYPSGESCGIKIHSSGILVISVQNVSLGTSPAKDAGIIPGDFIKKINGITLNNSDHLIEYIKNNKDKEITIEYERNKVLKTTSLTPVYINGEYVLGMWVRDSIAGLGTLTYYTFDKKNFVALGHSISDIDTGETIPVKNGNLVYSEIVSIKKGSAKKTGGLTGVFLKDAKNIGTITQNTDFGIFGSSDSSSISPPHPPLPIGYKNEVSLGKAQIISTVLGTKPEYYDIEIVKINKQTKPDIKGMVIKITDEKLLKRTGGIVQGMSGSPIIQNGKLIGAVTHVFVNDSTKGYGIFIENMLAEAEKIK